MSFLLILNSGFKSILQNVGQMKMACGFRVSEHNSHKVGVSEDADSKSVSMMVVMVSLLTINFPSLNPIRAGSLQMSSHPPSSDPHPWVNISPKLRRPLEKKMAEKN